MALSLSVLALRRATNNTFGSGQTWELFGLARNKCVAPLFA